MSKLSHSEILKQHGLKSTPARLKVLSFLASTGKAQSHQAIEHYIGDQADRVTVYRILHNLEEHGIIHKIFDNHGLTKYALCHSDCDVHEHHDEHIHFSCTECNTTTCIDSVALPMVKLPKGYTATASQYSISGICKNCNV